MAEDMTVLAIFTDVRGFTNWSEANEVFINLDNFVEGFFAVLGRRFKSSEFELKPLGDGALLIKKIPDDLSGREVTRLLGKVLSVIRQVEADFSRHCSDFAGRVGHAADLNLGWGIVRGKVIKVGSDWAGHNLNKCSRLCNEARPFGVVIDRDDFPELPAETRGLVKQIRRLRGVGEVPVWVSSEIASQFIPRERLREEPEVHVAGTCLIEGGSGEVTLLFARRSAERRLFPGKLEGCGGQLRYSESFTDGVRRHFRTELGIDVEVMAGLHTLYEIREPNEPLIPGLRFLCKQIGTTEPASANHSEIIRVSEKKFRDMPDSEFVGDLKHEVVALLERYKSGVR
ncbi:NUDIX domain-containing protein [Lentzea sp. NPDC058436]|uniref:NUDIX domain-containing protein n=1 Tax=Lentzea sp. NPDC058436 TaxID=3346499 RepID=UPI00364E15F4